MEGKLYLLKRTSTGGAQSPESSQAETESRVMNARGWGRGGRSEGFNGLQFLLEVTQSSRPALWRYLHNFVKGASSIFKNG